MPDRISTGERDLMQTAIEVRDKSYSPPVRPGPIDRAILSLLNDPRDLPFAHLILTIAFTLVPAAVYLFWPGRFSWWLAPVYWGVVFFVFLDRFVLMLHNTSHRKLFRRARRALNGVIPWGLGPFLGLTPETYYSHHIAMHHVEGNGRADLSSTEPFQRDSLLHFLAYLGRFFFGVIVELSLYHHRRGRRKMLVRTLVGELTYGVVVAGLFFLSWQAALTVFVVPLVVVRFLMMAGNWGQHAFIDGDDPRCLYRNSITCINTRYNRRAWNDGYHIGHHLKPSLHWSQMPADFTAHVPDYAREGALVFEGLDYFQIWALLMMKCHGVLARHVVALDGATRSLEDTIALLKSRLRPVCA
jgi:fatty acid desaturase